MRRQYDKNKANEKPKKCWNCHAPPKDHANMSECDKVYCWKCRQPILPEGQRHVCIKLPYSRAMFHRGYLWYHQSLQLNQPFKSNAELLGTVSARFATLLNSLTLYGKEDRAIITTASFEGTPNAIIAPTFAGAYNVEFLIDMVEKFQFAKIKAMSEIQYPPKSLIVDIIGNGNSETVCLTFELDKESKELRNLLLEADHESELRIYHPGLTAIVAIWRCSRYENGRFCIELKCASEAKWTKEEIEAVNSRHFSISFDQKERAIGDQIREIREFMKLSDDMVVPSCLSSFRHNFEKPIQVALTKEAEKHSEDYYNSLIDKLLEMIRFKGKLTDSQRKAILNGLMLDFSAIKGPSGTGKTFDMALIVLIQAFFLGRKVLILTSRNQTGDDLADKIDEFVGMMSLEDRAKLLENKILTKFMVRHYSHKRYLSRKQQKYGTKNTDADCLKEAGIVITTVGHSSVSAIYNYFADFVCIDESSLLTPVEFWFTVASRNSIQKNGKRFSQLLVVGDPDQMRPRYSNIRTMSDKVIYDFGLDMTIIAQVARNQIGELKPLTVLDRCFRGPAPIFQPVFNQFYPNDEIKCDPNSNAGVKLTAGKRVSSLKSLKPHNVAQSIWIETKNDTDFQDGLSRRNDHNIEVLMKTLLDLVQFGKFVNGSRVQPSDITFCSFYKGHLHEVERRIKANHLLRGVEILTADEIQGLQNKIVILDVVRSREKAGFLKGETPEEFGSHHNGRVVVGLTRPEELRIVIGNALKMPKGSDLRLFQEQQRDAAAKGTDGPNTFYFKESACMANLTMEQLHKEICSAYWAFCDSSERFEEKKLLAGIVISCLTDFNPAWRPIFGGSLVYNGSTFMSDINIGILEDETTQAVAKSDVDAKFKIITSRDFLKHFTKFDVNKQFAFTDFNKPGETQSLRLTFYGIDSSLPIIVNVSIGPQIKAGCRLSVFSNNLPFTVLITITKRLLECNGYLGSLHGFLNGITIAHFVAAFLRSKYREFETACLKLMKDCDELPKTEPESILWNPLEMREMQVQNLFVEFKGFVKFMADERFFEQAIDITAAKWKTERNYDSTVPLYVRNVIGEQENCGAKCSRWSDVRRFFKDLNRYFNKSEKSGINLFVKMLHDAYPGEKY